MGWESGEHTLAFRHTCALLLVLCVLSLNLPQQQTGDSLQFIFNN